MWQKNKITGFLLTRHWRDTEDGIELRFWVSTESGPAQIVIDKQRAVCFIRRDNELRLDATIQRKPLDLCTLQHEAVDGIIFS